MKTKQINIRISYQEERVKKGYEDQVINYGIQQVLKNIEDGYQVGWDADIDGKFGYDYSMNDTQEHCVAEPGTIRVWAFETNKFEKGVTENGKETN